MMWHVCLCEPLAVSAGAAGLGLLYTGHGFLCFPRLLWLSTSTAFPALKAIGLNHVLGFALFPLAGVQSPMTVAQQFLLRI